MKGGIAVLLLVMRIAECLAVIAGDDDERVVCDATFTQGIEETAEVAVCLADDVEVIGKFVGELLGRLAFEEINTRHLGPLRVGMMCLIRPAIGEERLAGLLVNELDQPVKEVAIFGAPRGERRSLERAEVLHGVVALALEYLIRAAPLEVAIVQISRARAALLHHGRKGRR
jgi:hypothetical protein